MSRLVIVALLLAAITGGLTAAPASGVIVGLVVNRTGVGATRLHVTLVEVATGTRHPAVSDDLGFFSFSSLPPGEYRIQPASGQFLPSGSDKLVLDPGEKRSWRLFWIEDANR